MAGLPSSSCQTTQDSLRRRSSKLLCLLGSISSLRSMSREERILKCHSLAECGGCWWLRSLAWTKHLLFPELSTVADCTVEAVGCLQYSSHQFLPCPALPCPALPCPALPCPALPASHQQLWLTWTCCWAWSCCRKAFVPAVKRRSRVAPSCRSCCW